MEEQQRVVVRGPDEPSSLVSIVSIPNVSLQQVEKFPRRQTMEGLHPCSRESSTAVTASFLLVVLSGSRQAIREAPLDSTLSFSSDTKTVNLMCVKSLCGAGAFLLV